jgi:hypothetical protein
MRDIIASYQLRKFKTKSLSEVQVIESLGRKLNLAFRQNYDRSAATTAGNQL